MYSNKKIDAIREKVSRTSLFISRIPDKAKTEFKELAQAEFEGDYGFTLKWLLDFRNGILSNPNQILSDKIDFLADQIKGFQESKEKDSGIKLISGKKMKRRNDKDEQTRSPSGQKPSI